MNVVPRRHAVGITWEFETVAGCEPRIIPMPPGEGMWIQCEATEPKSAVGRHVNVFIPPDLVVPLMKELRRTAIAARKKGMTS